MAFWKRETEPAEWLARVALFEGFTPEELSRVARLSEERTAAAGDQLMDQGDPGLECFVVVDGTVGVSVRGENVAAIGPGGVVGEMALIDHRPRSATVVAETDVKLLRFDTRQFRQLLEDLPKAGARVRSVLQERLERESAVRPPRG